MVAAERTLAVQPAGGRDRGDAQPRDQLAGHRPHRAQRRRRGHRPRDPPGLPPQALQGLVKRGLGRRGIAGRGRGHEIGPLPGVRQPAQVDQTGDDTVLQIVRAVRNVISPVHELRLHASPASRRAIANPAENRHVVGVDTELGRIAPLRPRVFQGRVEGGAGEVEPGFAPVHIHDLDLETGELTQALGVALETPTATGSGVKRGLAVVTERRMPDVMREAGGVDQVRIRAEGTGQSPADLCGLQRMGEPGTREVVVERADDLCLAGQPAQCAGVQDTRAVPLEPGSIVGCTLLTLLAPTDHVGRFVPLTGHGAERIGTISTRPGCEAAILCGQPSQLRPGGPPWTRSSDTVSSRLSSFSLSPPLKVRRASSIELSTAYNLLDTACPTS